MTIVIVVSGHPNSVIRDRNTLGFSDCTLSPFKVEDVISYVIPFLPDVLCVVEFLVNAAWLVLELSTCCP